MDIYGRCRRWGWGAQGQSRAAGTAKASPRLVLKIEPGSIYLARPESIRREALLLPLILLTRSVHAADVDQNGDEAINAVV
jgi:hypothetical protein